MADILRRQEMIMPAIARTAPARVELWGAVLRKAAVQVRRRPDRGRQANERLSKSVWKAEAAAGSGDNRTMAEISS